MNKNMTMYESNIEETDAFWPVYIYTFLKAYLNQ